MSPFILQSGLSLLAGAAAIVAYRQIVLGKNPLLLPIRRYQSFWDQEIAASHLSSSYRAIPTIQLVALIFLVWSGWNGDKIFIVLASAFVSVLFPPMVLYRSRKKRRELLENDLDAFLLGLSDALTAVPNLIEALSSLHQNLNPPIKDEISVVLSEVRLGRSIDDALGRLAVRLDIPALHAAVGAALMSHRVGGDLSRTLRRIAAATREMARLEGVVKTKTAEGRTQAWVIGLMPPALILLINYTDPNWLAPMWDDPIGWIALGGVAILEIVAVALIRHIMAVEI